MFQRVLRSWGRWVGRRPEPETGEERRVWLRYPCDLETTLKAANDPQPQRLSGRVLNISRGGVQLLVNERVEPGALLSVDLPGATDSFASRILAYVVRVVTRPGGGWTVGCTFATELDDEDLEPFAARRLKAVLPDQRAWVRFPCDARASYRLVRSPESRPESARVLNISPSGIGLQANTAIDIGALLSLELSNAQGQDPLTMMASVVRVTPQAGGSWVLGCNFIRELSEQELQALL
jgi:hypothetical protein